MNTHTFHGQTLVPEAISEGGVRIIDGVAGYKSFRFFANDSWPWIDDMTTVMQNWRVDNSRLFATNHKGTITLKAFEGAPGWTRQELLAIRAVFSQIGMSWTKLVMMKRGTARMPSAEQLAQELREL